MSGTTMVIVIVAIVAMTILRISKWYAPGNSRTLAAPPEDDAEKAMLRGELEELRERIKVLERIATDANTTSAIETRRVSDEIEALRDKLPS